MKLSEINPYDDYFVGTKENGKVVDVKHLTGNEIFWEARGEKRDLDVLCLIDGDEIEVEGGELERAWNKKNIGKCKECGDIADKRSMHDMNGEYHGLCGVCNQERLQRRRYENILYQDYYNAVK